MRSALPLILVSAYLFGCESEVLPPERPDGVPESAVWGGGVDGGSWLDCMPTERAHSFACSVFWDSDGALRAKGTYLLRRVTWDNDEERAIYTEVQVEREIAFDFFDGVVIHLEGSLALVPNGIIDYPFGDGHGKKQRYEIGSQVGPEEEY